MVAESDCKAHKFLDCTSSITCHVGIENCNGASKGGCWNLMFVYKGFVDIAPCCATIDQCINGMNESVTWLRYIKVNSKAFCPNVGNVCTQLFKLSHDFNGSCVITDAKQ